MGFLKAISKGIRKYATGKNIIALLLMFIIVLALMEAGPAGSRRLKEINSGMGMLDMQFGYSQDQVYSMLNRVGKEGRSIYAGLLGLDYIFAVVFMLLQSLMMTLLLDKTGLIRRWGMLNLLPFARSAMDILENCLILAMLSGYPSVYPVVAGLASGVTVIKWIIYYGILGTLFLLGAMTTRNSIQAADSKRKYRTWENTI